MCSLKIFFCFVNVIDTNVLLLDLIFSLFVLFSPLAMAEWLCTPKIHMLKSDP